MISQNIYFPSLSSFWKAKMERAAETKTEGVKKPENKKEKQAQRGEKRR